MQVLICLLVKVPDPKGGLTSGDWRQTQHGEGQLRGRVPRGGLMHGFSRCNVSAVHSTSIDDISYASESTVDSISCRQSSSALTCFQHFRHESEKHVLGFVAGASDKRITMRADWLVGGVSFLDQTIVPVRIFYGSASPLRASICYSVILLISLQTGTYLVQEHQLWKAAFQKRFSSAFLSDRWQDGGSRSLVFTHALIDCQPAFSGSVLCCKYYLVASTFSKYITLQFNHSQEGILALRSSLHVRHTVGQVMQKEWAQAWTWRGGKLNTLQIP